MESSAQVSDSEETAQSASVAILHQDQLSGATMPRELFNMNNADESDMIRTCSSREQTCARVEMSAVAKVMTDEVPTDESRCAQGKISLPDSSATNTPPSLLDFPDAIATMAAWTAGIISPDEDNSLMASNERISSQDAPKGLGSSRNSDTVDPLRPDMPFMCMNLLDTASGSNDLQLATGLLMFGKVLLGQADMLAPLSSINHAIDCLTSAARISQGEHATQIQVLQTLARAYNMQCEKSGRVEGLDSAIEYQQQTIACAGDKHESHPILVAELGDLFYSRYRVSGNLDDIHRAIEHQTYALSLMPGTENNRASLLNNLGISYASRFERLDKPEDISRAIGCQTRAVQLTPEGQPDLPDQLSNLGGSYMSRFERLGELEDINKAIDFTARAVQLIPEEHPSTPIQLNSLGNSYLRRYERLGKLEDINKAIDFQTRAVQLTPEGHLDMPNRLNSLGTSYSRRHKYLGQPEDISKAIKYQTQAVQFTPEGHPDTPLHLSNLGTSYSWRYQLLGELEDIAKGIDCHTLAVQLTPKVDPDLASKWINLGTSHMLRHERLGGLGDMSKAIDCHTRAVQLTLEGHPNTPLHLDNLGGSYLRRYERLGELEDIGKAIDCRTRAAQLTPEAHPDMPDRLDNLGNSYLRRYERLGELEDITKAISYQTRAVQLTPEGHPDAPLHLDNLGNSYLRQYERLGELEYITQGIDCQTHAVELTTEGHPYMPDRLNNLGSSYLHRFEHLNKLEDISKAIDCQTRAVQLTPGGHPSTAIHLNNLGNSYLRRYGRLGELEDITKAIGCQARAVQFTPAGHPDMPGRLNNLGSSYTDRFVHTRELEDINKGIDCHIRAVQLTPEGHPNSRRHLGSLGNSYASRYQHLGELEDINKAIDCHIWVVQVTPEGDPDLALKWSNLGGVHLCRFARLGEREDIKRAIEIYEQALHLLPQTHSHVPIVQFYAGASYRARFIHYREPQDRLKALEHWETAACTSTGIPQARIRASRGWAGLLSESDRSTTLPAHRITMQLLPEVIWLGMTSSRRYESITEIGAVVVEAVSAAIAAKQYSLALEWLEQGRSIVWNQTLQIRTPFDELATVDSALAQRLQQVAKQLEVANRRISDATPFGAHTMSSEQATLQHHRLVDQYNELISQARDLPNFQDFMHPKKAAELMPAARSGPVVVVNVHAEHCDALILSPESGQIAHVPLPNLSEDRIARLHGLMRDALAQSGIRERKFLKPSDQPKGRFEDTLISLWYRLVKPILGFLGYTSKLPVDQLPRVTWCTTGALSFLPIHAAGDYGSGQDRIFDYAITSYTPTLSALLATTSQSPNKISGVIAVSQESTPGLSDLPGTKDELVHIKRHLEGLPYEQLENSQATPDAVLDAMEKYECVHLACHASQHAESPTQSCFHLHNDTLSLDKIAQRSLKNKSLAFLSACQTATGDQKMPDEAIHLAAGMLVAGYPTVIATMWSISDYDAPSVADGVYGQLVRDGKLYLSEVAKALHVAAGALRAKVGEDAFSRWVPYIHMGL